jgi:hypothetical protein
MLGMLVVGGVAYVLGAKAGRERYDQIIGRAKQLTDSVRGAVRGNDSGWESSETPGL